MITIVWNVGLVFLFNHTAKRNHTLRNTDLLIKLPTCLQTVTKKNEKYCKNANHTSAG